jgi:hypothetical protein
MHNLVALLIPIIILVTVAVIIVAVTERFSPDPLITVIVRWVVFAIVLIFLLTKLLPLLGIS